MDMYYTNALQYGKRRNAIINDIRNYLKEKYDYCPSKSLIYRWIKKYTHLAIEHFKEIQPRVGDTWILNETQLEFSDKHNLWIIDILDSKTGYLLASRLMVHHTSHDIQILLEEACRRTCKTPKKIKSNSNCLHTSIIEEAIGFLFHTPAVKNKEPINYDNSELVDIIKSTIGTKSNVMYQVKSTEPLNRNLDGWFVYYNFLKHDKKLNGKTPAEKADIHISEINWAGILSVSGDNINLPLPGYG
jgi:hypothetical protein